MKARVRFLCSSLLFVAWLSACVATRPADSRDAGTLLIVGGGLDNDCRPIYERLVELASASGPANIVVVSAATGPEEEEITDKTEALKVWAPQVPVRAIRRATSTEESVAAIDAATALLFTGGDQKRITARYRPEDQPSPEWLAMRRLLARGGVIAGCSAGDAMMGELMLLGGGNALALGIVPQTTPDEEAPVVGPQIGPGMRFLPWALTDSHFFERDRIGRLVAALEQSGTRLGLGVGEDGCVEVNLATGDVFGVGVGESLLVDCAHLERDGLVRTGLLARVIAQGDALSLRERLTSNPPRPPALSQTPRDVPVVEPGQNRQLASWRIFRCASRPGAVAERLSFEVWRLTAWPAGDGEVAFEVGPH